VDGSRLSCKQQVGGFKSPSDTSHGQRIRPQVDSRAAPRAASSGARRASVPCMLRWRSRRVLCRRFHLREAAPAPHGPQRKRVVVAWKFMPAPTSPHTTRPYLTSRTHRRNAGALLPAPSEPGLRYPPSSHYLAQYLRSGFFWGQQCAQGGAPTPVEPRVLSGWAVASQHESWVGAVKAPCSTATMVGSARSSYRPSVDREPPTAGQQTRRWGSESSATSPAPRLAAAARPDRYCQGPGSGWQALPPHQSGSGASRPDGGAGAGWRSELAMGELEGHSQVRQAAESEHLG
jgi:hypothetical protein